MSARLRGILVDFGGTLDSEGLHWSTQFALAFAAAGRPVERAALDRAFLAADRILELRPGIEELSYGAHIEAQAGLMLDALGLPAALAPVIAAEFVGRARPHLRRAAALLQRYRPRFRFGLVSNFTANLPRILEETGLAPLLHSVTCSALVGASKPDPAIFARALDALGLRPDEAAMLGDSLPADIEPARRVGLTTVWIRGDRVFGPADERAADFVAAGLAEALGICEGM